MNSTNPLLPQGSLQQAKGKSNVRIAVFTILAIHVVLLCGLLIQGCKRNPPPVVEDTTPTNTVTETFGQMPTNNVPLEPTNALPIETNLPLNNSTATVATPAPIPQETVTPTPAETKVHVVAKNESLSTIAIKEHVSLKALQEANPTVDPLKLQIGQKLNVPSGAASTGSGSPTTTTVATSDATVYVVKAGDALEKIAKQNNTTVKAIKAANGMKTDRINVGQKLKIPAAETTAK